MAADSSAQPEAGASVSRVYQALRGPIVDGEIPPGARINIDAVARELRVSQTPVREALQRLEADDLLVYTPGRGYRTTPILDPAGLRSLFEFRLLVEPWAAGSAASDRLANPADALGAELSSFERIAGEARDVRQDMLAHDTRFHGMILSATGNEVVRLAFAQTHCHLHVFRLYQADADAAATLEEHLAIGEAIGKGAADSAGKAMTQHLRHSYQRSAAALQVRLLEAQSRDGTGASHPRPLGSKLGG